MNLFEKLANQCPENILHKLYMLRGDLKALDGNLPAALGYFQTAIQCAEREGFLCLRGLAHERAAMALKRLGKVPNTESEAKDHLRSAMSLYEQWGSPALSAYLKRRHNL